MGSMRRKRRKKLAKAWKEFQAEHGLSDAELKLAKSAGYPLDRLLGKLATDPFCHLPIREAISLIHSQHQQTLAQRRAVNASASRESKVAKKKQPRFDPEWAKAKKLCRLNQDDIRKAKELGLKPKALIKNIPSPTQRWKLPVKYWITELYQQRCVGKAARPERSPSRRRQQSGDRIPSGYTTAFDAYLAGDFAALYAFECQREKLGSDI